MNGNKGNPKVLRLEMSLLNLAVEQRYESKDDFMKIKNSMFLCLDSLYTIILMRAYIFS